MNIFLGESGKTYLYSITRSDGKFYNEDSYQSDAYFLPMSPFKDGYYLNTYTYSTLSLESGFLTIYESGSISPIEFSTPYISSLIQGTPQYTTMIKYPLSHNAPNVSGVGFFNYIVHSNGDYIL